LLALADVARECQVEELGTLLERAGANLDGERAAVSASMMGLEGNDLPCARALAEPFD
jgi:hypothetical protein